MKQRIITGTILTVVLGILIYFGEGNLEFLFSGSCVILAVVASYEFTKMLRVNQKRRWFDFVSVFMTFTFSLMSVLFFDRLIYYVFVFIYLLALFLIYAILFVSLKEFSREDFGNQILTIFYCSLGFIAFAYLRKESMILFLYLLFISVFTDIFAYFIGIKFGKHKLAIKISPKKSIEGAGGGLIMGSIIATIFAYYYEVFDFNVMLVLLLSIFLSCISQVGDLIASKFKREANIKDYSNIFPGHGGVLDRFDSSMFAAIFLMLAIILT